jgi:transcriptional regulator with XRE-family HTH domain
VARDEFNQEIARRFGARVRELRTASGVSQEDFAHACGIHRTHVSFLERGERTPTLDTVARVAAGLGMNLAELLVGVDEGVPLPR